MAAGGSWPRPSPGCGGRWPAWRRLCSRRARRAVLAVALVPPVVRLGPTAAVTRPRSLHGDARGRRSGLRPGRVAGMRGGGHGRAALARPGLLAPPGALTRALAVPVASASPWPSPSTSSASAGSTTSAPRGPLSPGLIPVVKGNGYGFGRERLARLALDLGADELAVGTVHEVGSGARRPYGHRAHPGPRPRAGIAPARRRGAHGRQPRPRRRPRRRWLRRPGGREAGLADAALRGDAERPARPPDPPRPAGLRGARLRPPLPPGVGQPGPRSGWRSGSHSCRPARRCT